MSQAEDANQEIIRSFEQANREQLKKVREELRRFVGWVEFRPEIGPGEAEKSRGPVLRLAHGGRAKPPLEETSEELTSVMTRLGPADLATVNLLITAGIASSRAEVLRWAVGRIRENPVYAQLQDRVPRDQRTESPVLSAARLPGLSVLHQDPGGCPLDSSTCRSRSANR